MYKSVNDKDWGLRFNHKAMHTRFAVFIRHEDPRYAEQAAAEAFRRLDGIEQDFSLFIDNSDISRINRAQPDQAIQVGLDTFDCLTRAIHLSRITGGAFDITAMNGRPSIPAYRSIVLDASGYTALKRTGGIRIDLGGIGKGFAVDAMAVLLADWDIESALVHGGASTALAVGPPEGHGWKITVSSPEAGGSRRIIRTFHLRRRALSGSGIEKGPHIIDPGSGLPATGKCAAWALAPDATSADGLSTAFMVMTPEEIGSFCSGHSDVGALTLNREGKMVEAGAWPKSGFS